MMKIKQFVVGQLQTNCYLLKNEYLCAVIDPGDGGQEILDHIQSNNLKCTGVVATHGHFDHLMSVLEIVSAYDVSFKMSKKDDFLRKKAKKLAKYFNYANLDPVPVISDDLNEKSSLSLANINFNIIKTPGHTPGSLSFYNKKEGILFCGDLIFENGGIGRYDFPYSNFEKLKRSIEKVTKLPKKTVVYSGHGENFTIGDFRNYYDSL